VTGDRSVVVLMRHGEVENPDDILYGRLPGFHLSERGQRQAKAVAAHLAQECEPFAAIVSSPLERAQETAQPLADALGPVVTLDDRLIESGDSVFEGRPHASRWSSLRAGDLWHLRNPWRPSWGEAYRDIAGRVHAAIDDARRAHPGKRVVCVSHQSPIWVTRRAYEGKPLWHDPRSRQCAHASLTVLTFDVDQLVRIGYETPAGAL